MKTSILALTALVICCSLAGQNSTPPAVVFRGNCASEPDLPKYQEWFRQTRLPYGQPYVAQGKRKEQLAEQYSNLKLQMSMEEVEKVLGKADFSVSRPAARLATVPEPIERRCSSQVAYIFKKSSENMADMEDVAIYLFFSEGGKLYWASPQNLPNLKPLGSPTAENAEPHMDSWKEYTFADDGFAITVPESPNPHPDATLPDVTVYTVSVLPGTKLSLRVSHQKKDCASTLAQLKDGALMGKSGIDPSSVKYVSVDGHPGMEYQYRDDSDLFSADRFYCVNGVFYMFSVRWPSTQPQPAAVARIVSSFRLLNPESDK
jgi:hypothetical protein